MFGGGVNRHQQLNEYHPCNYNPIHSVGSNQQYCVSLPACYPTIIPYVPKYGKRNGQETSNTAAFNFGVKNYDCIDILDSPLCTNSQLIQRIRKKIDSYQTPSNDAHQIFQHLSNIGEQHGSGSGSNQIDTRQDVVPRSNSIMSHSRSPSLLQGTSDAKIIDERLSKSLHSLSPMDENNVEKTNTRVMDSSSSDHNSQESLVMSIPVPTTPHFSEQQGSSSLQSPANSIGDFDQQELSTQSSKSTSRHRSPKGISNDKIGKQDGWFKKLTNKLSIKRFNTTSAQNLSPGNISPMYNNDPNRVDLDQLHMREAMAALEPDLTKEAHQASINKKRTRQQNGFMRILTAPSRCCRSCRTQRRLATVALRSIDIAIKDI